MKRTILISLLLTLCTSVLFAQSEILPDGRKWIVRRALPLHPDKIEETITYYIKGYTTINGYKYSKLYEGNSFAASIRKEGTKYICYYTNWNVNKDTLVFDESWNVGDTTVIGDPNPRDPRCTVAETGYIQGRKYWDIEGEHLRWVQGVGFVNAAEPFQIEHGKAASATFALICCTEANGDTLYVDRDLLYMLSTGIRNISAEDISITQQDGECIVTLPVAAEWAVTLYNAAGVSVACKAGEGSEIFLPVEGNGTYILILEVGGKQYTKRIAIK